LSSPDLRSSAYSSSFADNWRASSFRSSLQDFERCGLPKGSDGKEETVALCGNLGLGFFGERGDRLCGRFAFLGTLAECSDECAPTGSKLVYEGWRCGLGVRLARGCPGMGVNGTFSRMASSGTSSSKSSYSASSCLTVFLPGCHELRLTNRPLSYETFGVGKSGDSGDDIRPLAGEGDRDESLRPVAMKDDDEGLVNPLRMPRPCGCERWLPTATCRLELPLALRLVASLICGTTLRFAISSFSVLVLVGRLSVGLLSGLKLQSSTDSRPVSSRVISSKLASFSLLALSRDNDLQDDELLLELLL
jgi:hypothetical protein